jgi:hypothetical protein
LRIADCACLPAGRECGIKTLDPWNPRLLEP